MHIIVRFALRASCGIKATNTIRTCETNSWNRKIIWRTRIHTTTLIKVKSWNTTCTVRGWSYTVSTRRYTRLACIWSRISIESCNALSNTLRIIIVFSARTRITCGCSSTSWTASHTVSTSPSFIECSWRTCIIALIQMIYFGSNARGTVCCSTCTIRARRCTRKASIWV